MLLWIWHIYIDGVSAMHLSNHKQAQTQRGWEAVIQIGVVLAAAMGVGRFVFTPILPLMESQAGLSKHAATLLATGNYLGYLIGAGLGIVIPALARRRSALRASGVVLVLSLLAMPLAHTVAAWLLVRGLAGVASAVIFMVAGNAILSQLASTRPHAVGWAYGGVGAGIAASGALIIIVKAVSDWQVAWYSSAALAALLLAAGWSVGAAGQQAGSTAGAQLEPARRHHGWFVLLAGSYFLEGTGYIIAGTFLVAAVAADGPGWLGGTVWTIVGLAAIPSCALWTWMSTHVSRPTLITGALLLQAVGVALPALSGSVPAATVSAVLFGATFVGITTLSLATGRHLGVHSAVAILTAGYGSGR